MSSPINSKSFFLISFLPALAYTYLEMNYSLKVAIVGGLGLAILEMILEKVFTKHVHSISKLNFGLVIVLGLMSFTDENGLWFKLQPMMTGVIFGGVVLYKNKFGKSLFVEMSQALGNKGLPDELMKMMEFHFAIFFALYGVFMGIIAYTTPTPTWLFCKTVGFYIASAVFVLFEVFFMRGKVKKMLSAQRGGSSPL